MKQARDALGLALAAMILARTGSAQVPVGFLPGLNEGVGVWYSAGSSLSSSFNIAPFYPNLTTTSAFSSQRSALGALDTSTFLVGHSAGGVVARYKGQSQKLAGVITYGTPNYGAPLEETYPVFCDYIGGTIADAAFLGIALFHPDDNWVLDQLNPDYDLIIDDVGILCDGIVEALDLTGGTAGTELYTDGGFMNDTLNAAGNVSIEQANVSTEASVVMVTDNFLDAGEWKAALPDGTGEAIGHIQQYVGAAAAGLEAYLILNYPDDDHDLDIAAHLGEVAQDLLFMDEAWCQVVSGTLFFCWDNDEVVPIWSQALGRGFERDFDNGPVHTREAQNGAAFLSDAFLAVGIQSR